MAPNPSPSQRPVAPLPERSPLGKSILAIGLALLTGGVLFLTGYAMYLWSFYIKHPGSLAGSIEQTLAQYVTLVALGGCLLHGLSVWLFAHNRWMARSTAKWMWYGTGAIATLNGVLLSLPLLAR
ncbi:hypothetical protein H6G89_26915 [Oscillatoria sp. FACHB-1407]|nr:hypothetical protein [Oscillatoria sp. FACHB-1407]MBD2464644.1 hypothetical protein [Oscillatoria sp. FACHB-1407]